MNKQKIVLLSLLCMISIYALIGCANNVSTEGIAISSFDIGKYGCSPSDTCHLYYRIAFIDTSTAVTPGYYMPVAISNSGTAKGDVVKVNFPETNSVIELNLHYYSILPGFYDLRVYRCADSASGKDISKAKYYGVAKNKMSFIYSTFDPDCYINCCTNVDNNGAVNYREWVTVKKKDTTGLTGVSARIKTRWGKLCGDATSSNEPAFSNVHINVANESVSPRIWAQCGFSNERVIQGFSNSNKILYLEIEGDTTHFWEDSLNYTPVDNISYNYVCSLNTGTGKWFFHLDGQLMDSWIDSAWINQTGTSVSWTGELYGRECDMAGTQSDPCVIEACSLKYYSRPFQGANITPGLDMVGSADLSEWNLVFINSTEFHIYDVNPLP